MLRAFKTNREGTQSSKGALQLGWADSPQILRSPALFFHKIPTSSYLKFHFAFCSLGFSQLRPYFFTAHQILKYSLGQGS